MKNILIVGASRGIGFRILEQNIEDAQCINISRSRPSIQHEHLTSYEADVLNDPLPEIDALDSLIYCPGSINLKPIGSLKEEDFLEDFRINLLGAVRVIKQYVRALKRSKNASILMFGTVAVEQGMPFHSSISVAKAGVQALAKSLAAELAPSVRVNCIAPSITDTPLASSILKNEKSRSNIADRHPLKKIMTTEDIASMASFLISDKASSITGQIIGVDGGMSSLKI